MYPYLSAWASCWTNSWVTIDFRVSSAHVTSLLISKFCAGLIHVLTHWGWVMHICVCNLTIIGSDNGLSPGRSQAIIWTNAGILLIRTSGTNFSEILSEMHTFSFKKMHLKMSSGKWRPFCLGLNELRVFSVSCHCLLSWSISAYILSLTVSW